MTLSLGLGCDLSLECGLGGMGVRGQPKDIPSTRRRISLRVSVSLGQCNALAVLFTVERHSRPSNKHPTSTHVSILASID